MYKFLELATLKSAAPSEYKRCTMCRARPEVTVVRLHSSGGVVTRTPQVRKSARTRRVKEYFYGVRGDLSPHSQTVSFEELRIFRIGGGPRAPSSALPLGLPPLPERSLGALPPHRPFYRSACNSVFIWIKRIYSCKLSSGMRVVGILTGSCSL